VKKSVWLQLFLSAGTVLSSGCSAADSRDANPVASRALEVRLKEAYGGHFLYVRQPDPGIVDIHVVENALVPAPRDRMEQDSRILARVAYGSGLIGSGDMVTVIHSRVRRIGPFEIGSTDTRIPFQNARAMGDLADTAGDTLRLK
jgi:hypothetical protein